MKIIGQNPLKKAFYFALALHGIVFMVLGISTFWQTFVQKQTTTHFFTLMPPPERVSPQTTTHAKMSYEEFIQKRGTPKVTPKRATLDATSLQSCLKNIRVQETEVLSSAEREALQTYVQTIRQQIDLHWTKPKGLTKSLYFAKIQFTVSGRGHVTHVQIVESSGNDRFNTSATDVFSNLKSFGPPPGQKSHTFVLTFQISP